MKIVRNIFLFLFLPLGLSAQLKVANIFTDNMVLQRGERIHIWGSGVPGQKVQVNFNSKSNSATVKTDSSWSVYFAKQKANIKPQAITISSGSDEIQLQNILIGDIWICSGQSNMEWPMKKEIHWKQEAAYAQQPLIRFNNPPPSGRYVYGVAYTDSLNQRLTTKQFYQWQSWQVCDSATIENMSAVGYYFAKEIVQRKNIPIGLINVSIGGAPIETFISREALQHSLQFAAKVKGDWLQNRSLPEWIRQRGSENVGSNINGYKDDLGLNHAYKPGFAFAAGIQQLLPLPIKGVIWYQGESNSLEADRVAEYRALQHLLVDDYRSRWHQPDMPFYWVQLSSIDTSNYQSQYWPQFRDEQRKLLNEVAHGGMAVSSDIGFRNNVHPTNKKAVGERLARWALNKNYGEKIVPSGPLPLKALYQNGKVTVSFQFSEGLKTSDGEKLRGFSIDGKTDVQAVIKNDRVMISASQKPAYIYYGWKPCTDANLVNAEQLPASTFKIQVL